MNRSKTMRILNGYIAIYVPEHPKAMKSVNWRGYVYEHIVVAEKDLGRAIREDEDVHHLDFNRQNNSPENLLVLPGVSHGKLHMWLKSYNIVPVQKEVRRCRICDNPLRMTEQKEFCSDYCYVQSRKSVMTGISLDQMKLDFKELRSIKNVGKKYGLTDNGLKKWLKKTFSISNEEIKNLKRG